MMSKQLKESVPMNVHYIFLNRDSPADIADHFNYKGEVVGPTFKKAFYLTLNTITRII